jgi:hypothetical protein
MIEVQPFGFVCQARSKNGSALDKLAAALMLLAHQAPYLIRLQSAIRIRETGRKVERLEPLPGLLTRGFRLE